MNYKFQCSIAFLLLTALVCFSASAQTREERLKNETQTTAKILESYAPQRPSVTIVNSSEGKPNVSMSTGLGKIAGPKDRKHYFMNGNKISTEVYNYGGIAPGYGLLRNINNFVWHNLSYVFQLGPLVGGAVPDTSGKILHNISDGLWDYPPSLYPGLREVSPDGKTLWQFQPLPDYADPNQDFMASNPAPDKDKDGKPDSWPRAWYNAALGKYVWPGYLSQDASNADLEVFWAMDDRDNLEFAYYPYIGDTTRKGLGVQVDGRIFQWSNSLAENTMFFVYTISNISDKNLDTVVFGIYGDPDLGGGSPENQDDYGFFVPPYSIWRHNSVTGDSVFVDVSKIPQYSRSLVYFWDPDMKGDLGRKLGYLGAKFLESPGNAYDGIDNDGDGMIDERQDDGIDNDKDWDPANDDVGIDGVPNTKDEGEGDGMPTKGKQLPNGALDPLYPGEPNFEYTDLDESDQIGLTSFNSWTWNKDGIANDESMWNRTIPLNYSDISPAADIVFIFGSGYITLKKGESKRISTALSCGWTLDDLLTTAETVQRIYNNNYRFFKPPLTPIVTAVPGDRKVTLYWDSRAEQSIDPLTGKDFEGYVIYRSTEPTFNDIQTVTDGKGIPFLSQPLKDYTGIEARFDIDTIPEPYVDKNGNGFWNTGEPYADINNDGSWTARCPDPWKGYHPVPYLGRGVQYYLGNNSGLVHSFIDSNSVVNGQTYYYAVVAYDHGDSTLIPPTETTKKITVDPISSILEFDLNTVSVTPGPRSADYAPPVVNGQNVTHTAGIGTGKLLFEVMDDLKVKDSGSFQVLFKDSLLYKGKMMKALNYSVLNANPVTETFATYDTNYAQLGHPNIADDAAFTVTDLSGATMYTKGKDYVISYVNGSIRRTGTSAMPKNGTFKVTYRYYAMQESQALYGGETNPVFDGIRLRVYSETVLMIDTLKTRWTSKKTNANVVVGLSSGSRTRFYPADYEITFSDTPIDTAYVTYPTSSLHPVNYSVKIVSGGLNRKVLTYLRELGPTRNGKLDWGENICIFTPGSKGNPLADTLTWMLTFTPSGDTTVTPGILPTEGDVFYLGTRRPFDGSDIFSFTTTAGKSNTDVAASRLDKIYVVPNPYVGFSTIEPTNRLPGQTRGERRIYFENLPSRCTIRIYTLSGQHVQTLDHLALFDNSREYWNLLNRDGFSVAYGVYVAHVDAPGIGEKLVKFALIK